MGRSINPVAVSQLSLAQGGRVGDGGLPTEVTSGSSVDQILSVFTDASSIPSQYRLYIAALMQRGVLVNYPNVSTLNLNQVISRGETCGLVYQALASLGQVESFSSPYSAGHFASKKPLVG